MAAELYDVLVVGAIDPSPAAEARLAALLASRHGAPVTAIARGLADKNLCLGESLTRDAAEGFIHQLQALGAQTAIRRANGAGPIVRTIPTPLHGFPAAGASAAHTLQGVGPSGALPRSTLAPLGGPGARGLAPLGGGDRSATPIATPALRPLGDLGSPRSGTNGLGYPRPQAPPGSFTSPQPGTGSGRLGGNGGSFTSPQPGTGSGRLGSNGGSFASPQPTPPRAGAGGFAGPQPSTGSGRAARTAAILSQPSLTLVPSEAGSLLGGSPAEPPSASSFAAPAVPGPARGSFDPFTVPDGEEGDRALELDLAPRASTERAAPHPSQSLAGASALNTSKIVNTNSSSGLETNDGASAAHTERCPTHGLLYDRRKSSGCRKCVAPRRSAARGSGPVAIGGLRGNPAKRAFLGLLLGLVLGFAPAAYYASKPGAAATKRLRAEQEDLSRRPGTTENLQRFDEIESEVGAGRIRIMRNTLIIWIAVGGGVMFAFYRAT